MGWVNVAQIGGAVIGAWSSNKQAKAAKDAASGGGQDPRVAQTLWGANGGDGLIGRYQGMLTPAPSAAANAYTDASGRYLTDYAGSDLGAIRNSAMQGMNGNAAPMAQAAQSGAAPQAQGVQAQTVGAGLNAYAKGNMVDAPSQNNIDLSGSYNRFINGTPGANPYLDQSIDGAIAQNRLGFGQLQDDQTKNLMQNIMPSIRSNSVIAGQYGGSRQGVAEGNAIGTAQTELARAGAMFGQNATNAAVGAKANAYETDSNRALSATQGLGAQQYGVASQDAQTKNQAEFMNVGNTYDLGKFNAGLQQQNNQFNAGNALNNNQFNTGLTQQTNQTNTGLQQQTNLANQGAQLTTNGQNNGASLAGAGLLSGLLGQTSGTINAYDNRDITRAQQVNGLLAPYLSQSQYQQQPQTSVSGNTMAGGMSGLAMGGQLANLFGNSGTSTPTSFAGGFQGASAGSGIMGAFPAGGY